MAITVNAAFAEFLKDEVRLDPNDSKTAKASKGWLVQEISKFPEKPESFPKLHPDLFIDFGSFSRKTKRRPLDDIDLMVILHAQGCTYDEQWDKIEITVGQNTSELAGLCFDWTNKLNSRKVVNKFVELLSKVPNYKRAEIKRNQEAATLNLQSYSWTYDIVPSFITTPDHTGKNFYLIPDGNGNWKKTDPRIDSRRMNTVEQNNTQCSIRDIIRTLKYWNSRPTMPTMGSYLLENMILDYYEHNQSGSWIDFELPKVLAYIYHNIFNNVADPKGIQGNLNTLSHDEKTKIQNRAATDYHKAKEANNLETAQKMKEAIQKWQEIFGTNFPSYG